MLSIFGSFLWVFSPCDISELIFTEVELNFGVIVAESHPQYTKAAITLSITGQKILVLNAAHENASVHELL